MYTIVTSRSVMSGTPRCPSWTESPGYAVVMPWLCLGQCFTVASYPLSGCGQRFDFYYERFANHRDARQAAIKQIATLGDRLAQLLAVSTSSGSSDTVEFLHRFVPLRAPGATPLTPECDGACRAVMLVIRCRSILTWSYAYAFFCKEQVCALHFTRTGQ